MKECAFCDHDGTLSVEHITGKWMRELFPGRITVKRQGHDGKNHQWTWEKLDFKAKVVCESCNNTWMSEIEDKHAKPVLTPLITGQLDIPIGLPEARSIALYAFKTAVVIDQAYCRSGTPFFERSERHQFRNNLNIPMNVQMWLGGYIRHRGNGRFLPLYHQPQVASSESWLMYVCTFAMGNLVLQVAAVKNASARSIFIPTPDFEGLSIRFWPELQPNFVWPAKLALRDSTDFESFAYRWQYITVIS